jgi:hypothetical protein
MFMNPRIRQIMPAPPGWRELAVNRGHMRPFSDDPEDDIQVWPIVGFALVDEMGWDPADVGDNDSIEGPSSEPTVVLEQAVSAMVMTPWHSDVELTINIFGIDDATWRRVNTLQPNDDIDEWMDTAREALEDEKAQRAGKWRRD